MKIFRWSLTVIYICFILLLTVVARKTLPEPIFQGLFWDINNGFWNDIIQNILLFIPLGLLCGGWKGIVISFCLSCGIEIFQYYSRFGFCQVDDVINNVIGATIGVLIAYIFKRIISDKKLNRIDSNKNKI